jgi:hypothetical protein
VSAPTDVALCIEERAKSGLSLKQHAAAVAAKAVRLKQNHNVSCMSQDVYAAPGDPKPITGLQDVPSLDYELSRALEANAVEHSEFLARDESLSPTIGLAAHWLKKQRTEEPHLLTTTTSGSCRFDIADPKDSNASTQSTPAPFVAPVPVTATPGPHMNQENSPAPHQRYLSTEHLLPSHEPDSPQFDLSGEYNNETMTPAPFSPVALHHHDQDVDTTDLDHHGFSFHTTDHEDHTADDLLNTAAAVAASTLGDGSNHHRHNSLTLDDDDSPHDTLRITDL